MLKLCGFASSNYYNTVKLALLEKGVPFEEELVWPSREEAHLAHSPMGKLPYIQTAHGVLAESTVILEYLEEAYPETPLYPQDLYAKARNRELIRFIELHLELPARRLYGRAFFGGIVSDETRQEVERDLGKGIEAFARLAKFSPFVAGDKFTMADCAAAMHLALIERATRIALGRDVLEAIPQVKPYLEMISERPQVRKVSADRKANMELMAARRK